MAARFSVAARLKSCHYAFSGLWLMLKTQHNTWVQLAVNIAVIAAGFWLGVSAADWRWLTLTLLLMWVSEAFNTAFEHLCDVVSPGFHHSVQKSKDIAAGAVLLCSIGAAIIGGLTFWPYLR